MNIITIDCGASFLKGAKFQAGRMLRRAEAQSPPVHSEGSILHPKQITALCMLVRKMLLDLAGEDREVCLSLSTEMHGFLLAGEDGTACTDYISWQKEYGSIPVAGRTALQVFRDEAREEDVIHTGMPLRAGLPSCNLCWLQRAGYLQGKGPLRFYTLGDYILRMLSGKEPACHVTNAAATGLYDLYHNVWNGRLIQMVGGDAIQFPRVSTESISFVLEGVRVTACPAIGDQQAALLGAGVCSLTDLSFNLGTGAQVSKLEDGLIFGLDYQTRPYFDGLYLKTIPHLPSGRALNVYVRFMKDMLERFGLQEADEVIWNTFLQAAEAGDGQRITCGLSFFENPVEAHVGGYLSNIGEYDLTLDHLAASVFRKMSENFTWAASMVAPDRENVKRIVFSGGVARKMPLIRRLILCAYQADADVLVAENETLEGLCRYAQKHI